MRTNVALKLAPEPAPDLQASAAQARAELERLERHAANCEATFESVSAAFEAEAEPTKDAFIERGLAEQRAKAARRAHALYQAEVADLLRDDDIAKREEELAAILQRTSGNPYADQAAEISDILANTRKDLRGALSDLYAAIAAQNIALRRASDLSGSLGRRENFGYVNIDEVLRGICNELQPHSPHDDAHMLLIVTADSGDQNREKFRLELVDFARVGAS